MPAGSKHLSLNAPYRRQRQILIPCAAFLPPQVVFFFFPYIIVQVYVKLFSGLTVTFRALSIPTRFLLCFVLTPGGFPKCSPFPRVCGARVYPKTTALRQGRHERRTYSWASFRPVSLGAPGLLDTPESTSRNLSSLSPNQTNWTEMPGHSSVWIPGFCDRAICTHSIQRPVLVPSILSRSARSHDPACFPPPLTFRRTNCPLLAVL